MRYARVASRVFNTPLLIEPGRLPPITNYLLGRMAGQSPTAEGRLAKLEARRAEPDLLAGEAQPGFDGRCGALTADGIAVITITGELAQRADGMEADSGLLSYGEIERRIDAALADVRVRGILLEVDSPGGEAAGCFSLAEKIFNARAVKPIWALANECADSAAYALACATSRVLLPESGQVGSVGVIWQALDQSKFDQAMGVQYAVLQYGARKNDFNPHFPVSGQALAWAQEEVTRLGEQFVALVARNRGLDAAAVRATQAGLLFGAAAVAAGFADAILDPPGAGQTLVTKAAACMAGAMQKQFPGGSAAPAATRHHNPIKGASLMDKEEMKAAGEAQAQPSGGVHTLQPGELDALAQAAALEAARAEGLAAGVKAERARIAGILAHPQAAGREEIARGLACESDMGAEAAGRILAAAPKKSANPLAQAMAAIPDPQVGPDAPQAQAPGGNLMGQVMARKLGQAPGQKGAH